MNHTDRMIVSLVGVYETGFAWTSETLKDFIREAKAIIERMQATADFEAYAEVADFDKRELLIGIKMAEAILYGRSLDRQGHVKEDDK